MSQIDMTSLVIPTITRITNKMLKIPELTKMNPKTTAATQPDGVNRSFIFLLGVISSKWWINHNKKRIRIYLPESKRYLAHLLKREWGGTVSSINRDKHREVMWQTTSSRSLKQIKEAARKMKSCLPPEFYQQLTAFIRVHA